MKQTERKQVFWRILLVIYLLALFYFLFFAELMGREIVDRKYAYNLQLFKEIGRFLNHAEKLGRRAVFLNIYGNILGFLPFGFLIPLSFKRAKGGALLTLLTFTASLLIETVQLIFRVGSFDVDDILLNTLGGMAGYLGYLIVRACVKKWKGRYDEKEEKK